MRYFEDTLHREHTAHPCQDILQNLRGLSQCGEPIEVRRPVISGFEADAGSMSAIEKFVRGLPNIVGLRLLP